MRFTTSFFTTLVFSCCPCFAAFTDFNDFSQTALFDDGEIFSSGGLDFKAVDQSPNPRDDMVAVVVNSRLETPVLAAGPGVKFLLPANTQEVSFSYNNGGGRVLTINGVDPEYLVPDVSLSFLDGITVAGVAVSTVIESQSGKLGSRRGVTSETGTFTLRGPLTSFAIAGVELSIDDISVFVPEPSALVLLLSGLPLFARRVRRLS